mmetsp:Transcript_35570/g.85844  ORF Transcript_35570/g.85844 Transcript_35570/m.85844 type:complete len:412 (+) Transcript_35570:895-2130(+)
MRKLVLEGFDAADVKVVDELVRLPSAHRGRAPEEGGRAAGGRRGAARVLGVAHFHDRPIVPVLVDGLRRPPGPVSAASRHGGPRPTQHPPPCACRRRHGHAPRPRPQVHPRRLLVHDHDPFHVALSEHVVVKVAPRHLRPVPTHDATARVIVVLEEGSGHQHEDQEDGRARELLLHFLVLLLLALAFFLVSFLIFFVFVVPKAATAGGGRRSLFIRGFGCRLLPFFGLLIVLVILVSITSVAAATRTRILGKEILEPLGNFGQQQRTQLFQLFDDLTVRHRSRFFHCQSVRINCRRRVFPSERIILAVVRWTRRGQHRRAPTSVIEGIMAVVKECFSAPQPASYTHAIEPAECRRRRSRQIIGATPPVPLSDVRGNQRRGRPRGDDVPRGRRPPGENGGTGLLLPEAVREG